MNPLQKNIALWLVISLIFVMLYHLFSQPKNSHEDIIFSDFIASVENGQVSEVSIQGDHITGKFLSGKSFKTFAPKDSGVEHLKALALVSRTMREATTCAKLRANSDTAALHAVLTEARPIQAA